MVRYAIKTPPQHTQWTDILSTWKTADEIGLFESAWLWDHFYPLRPPFDGPCLEGWTALSALAQATRRLRLGAMVNGMPYRHPAVTANMAATLDIVSGGRFELGLGAGWNEMESDAYGIELGTLTERFDRFDEGLEIIRSLLDNETTTFQGEHYEIAEARCEPKPLQNKLPIVIGGKGPRRTLRAVARWADQWDMPFPESPDEWTALDELLQQHCADLGRDHKEITRSVHFRYTADDDPAALADHAAPFFAAGVDVVVWAMGAPISPERVEALASSL
jgi:F420-dependent oxidoreductase-like protein